MTSTTDTSMYEHRGCVIHRTPVPVFSKELKRETTGFEFVVMRDDEPLPVNITTRDRGEGLQETKSWVDDYLEAEVAAQAVSA